MTVLKTSLRNFFAHKGRMALSAVALGTIRLAEQEGREIPPTWATDGNGLATTDPAKAIAGMLQPMGGHKGFGLALIVDVLTGVLSGGGFGAEVRGLYADTTRANDCAHFFLALDVEAFGSARAFAQRMAQLAGQVTGGPLAPGVERLYLPGQIEDERAILADAHGVSLDPSVVSALERTAESVGIEVNLTEAAA